MTTTYDPSLAAPKDRVRQLVGDTASPWNFTDEAINYWVGELGSERAAAAQLADSMAASYSRRPKLEIDGFSIDYTAQSKQWRDLADQLRSSEADRPAAVLGVPRMGGVSLGTMASVESDTDRNPSRERIGADSHFEYDWCREAPD